MRDDQVILSGLIYIKHGCVWTRSEGPEYYFQTSIRGMQKTPLEFKLSYEKREKWEIDYHLEFYNRKMVEIKGRIKESTSQENKSHLIVIQVEEIKEIISELLPEIALDSLPKELKEYIYCGKD